MFDNTPLGSSNVVNTGFGYNTDKDRIGNSKELSNDPSVSANKYDLLEGEYFEAHRVDSNVADVDGPEGRADGIVAYSENDGVTGTTQNFAKTET